MKKSLVICCVLAIVMGLAYTPAPVIAASASPNAFGRPTTSVVNPGSTVRAVRGVRSGNGWTEQTRSEILARNGIVATSSGHASAAGFQILQAGGNAVDAAVATMAMIALTEPYSTNIGSEMFAIIYDAKTKQVYQISANGPSPKNYNREMFCANGLGCNANTGVYSTSGSPSSSGIWSAMIPGSVDGWDKMLKRFGTMGFKEVLEPARVKAIEGFPLEEIVANTFRGSGFCGNNVDPDTRALYCVNGRITPLYGIFKNPDLGRLFKVLQDQGVDGFYRGEVAEAMVKKANSLAKLPPGYTEFWSMKDLAEYQAEWIEPLKTNYHGFDIYETPPPSQGWAALEMMNIIEVCQEAKGIDLRSIGRENARFTHFMVEAKKLAYSDLHRYNADPKFSTDLYDKINNYFNNKAYAASLCDLIDMSANPRARATNQLGNLPGGTIYGASADRWGNMVSFVYSVYTSWGSQITVPGYGFQFSSRGAMFTYNPTHPNTLEGGKQPFITIIASFIMKDGEPVMAIGNMGGSTQPLGHAQHFVNLIDLGYNAQATSDAARWDHGQPTSGTGTVSLDYNLYDAVGSTLQSWGHGVSRSRGVGGGYEGIIFDKDPNEPEPWPLEDIKETIAVPNGNNGNCTYNGAGKLSGNCVYKEVVKNPKYMGPVNGVYRGGADTLHKDATAMGW